MNLISINVPFAASVSGFIQAGTGFLKAMKSTILDRLSTQAERISALMQDCYSAAAFNRNTNVIIQPLIKNDANSTTIDAAGDTPYLYTYFIRGRGQNLALKVDKCNPTDWEKDFINLKILYHQIKIPEIVTLNSQTTKLSGFMGPGMFEVLYQSFSKFSVNTLLDCSQSKELLEALKFSCTKSSSEIIASKIKKEKLVFININIKNYIARHCITLVFHKGYMAICNRINDNSYFPIEVFKIDTECIDSKIIEEIFSYDKKSEGIDGMKFLYELLPKKLSSSGETKKDAFCMAWEHPDISPKLQTRKNCSMTSIKAGLRFALTTFLFKNSSKFLDKASFNKIFSDAKNKHKILNFFSKIFTYNSIQKDGLKTVSKKDMEKIMKKARKGIINFIHSACKFGNLFLVKELLKIVFSHSEIVIDKKKMYNNLLFTAIYQKHLDIIEYLIEKGADSKKALKIATLISQVVDCKDLISILKKAQLGP